METSGDGMLIVANNGERLRQLLTLSRWRKHHWQIVVHFARELRVLEVLFQCFQPLLFVFYCFFFHIRTITKFN